MKTLLLLSDAQSVHTQKWAEFMAEQANYNTHLFSLNAPTDDWYQKHPITLHIASVKNKSITGKLRYLTAVKQLKDIIKTIKPNLVHAHYATSYGMLGRISGFHPFIISVWGSDVYEFPTKSILHKAILRRNLRAADLICSTSAAMARQTSKYSSKQIHVVPFGVDCSRFSQREKTETSTITIGTVKTLEQTYGIDLLLKAFAILTKKQPQILLELKIAGQGSQLDALKKLAIELEIQHQVDFAGKIPHNQVPDFLRSLDVFVALSRRESFGVAVIEAAACGCPVVVSNVGGLPEVVQHGETGFLVASESPEAAADAMEKLVLDKKLRVNFGIAARTFVENNYNWAHNAGMMDSLYHQILRA